MAGALVFPSLPEDHSPQPGPQSVAPIDLTRGAAIERFQFSVSFEPGANIETCVQTRSTLPGSVENLTKNNETRREREDVSLLDS